MNSKALISEFVSTFALTFVGIGAIAANAMSGGALGLVGIALAHGLTLAVFVTATAAISGGHVNPAVSIAAWSIGRLPTSSLPGYVLAQCAGALAAAGAIKLAVPASVLSTVGMGTPAVNAEAGVTVGMAFLMEVVLTFFLGFAILGTAIDRRAPKMGGLFIGLTVALDIMAGGPISGAAMNPARHLGPALLGGGTQNLWIYWAGPILGAVLAAQIYFRFQEDAA